MPCITLSLHEEGKNGMQAIKTHELKPDSLKSTTLRQWVYNGLDCCVTAEVLTELLSQLDNVTGSVYDLERDLQGPILDMNLRGVLVDMDARANAIQEYETIVTHLSENLETILSQGVGVERLNWRSPKQLEYLFYEVMGLPPVRFQGRSTVNRDALEKLSATYFLVEPIISHILALRDLGKKISVLKTSIDPDNRIRTSFNIAGTNTGRLSSSFSEFGESGGNLQNVEQRLRRIFISDPGKKFAYIDLEQAESRAVGAIQWNLFKDGRYLDACESGDLHTSVCRMAWPNLPWTGHLATDREVAETPFYRQHSHRHMAKVLGHGTNYGGSPQTMEKHTKVPRDVISRFQSVYIPAFAHREWWAYVRTQLREVGVLTFLSGRRRQFFGRAINDDVVRAAIAADPQGSIGDTLNRGMLKVWRLNICDLLLQVHDAILVQYDQEKEDEILPQLLKAIEVPIELEYGRTLLIPSEAKVGWNWADAAPNNPDGLKKLKGSDDRRRQRAPEKSLLDRQVSSIY
jgi:DNA polymerase-1